MEDIKPQAVETKEVSRGDRGEVGQATAGLTIKQRWHAEAFKRVDAEDKGNPNKRKFVRIPGTPSLKAFARALAKAGDPVAKDWFAHKLGSLNAKRSDTNIKAALEARNATKMAKRKKKGEGGGSK